MLKKIISNLSILSFLFVPLIPLLTTSCSSVNNNQNESYDQDDMDYFTSDDFFPQLYTTDYYDYVEFDEYAHPIIGDKFIMKVIEDVVNRVASSKGTIKFSITRFSDSAVDFNFWWSYNNINLYKTYSFNVGN